MVLLDLMEVSIQFVLDGLSASGLSILQQNKWFEDIKWYLL